MNKFILILILAGGTIGAQAQSALPNPSTDSILINSVVNDLYQTLSFKKVETHRYDSLTRFFIPQGLLIPAVGAQPLFLTVDQFISGAKENFQKQQITVWEEYETCSRTEVFGKVAHRFSTYKIRLVANGKESLRNGINAFQLIKQHNVWLITSVAWDRESQDLKIPSKYLCQ
jgi:hypothetical protein